MRCGRVLAMLGVVVAAALGGLVGAGPAHAQTSPVRFVGGALHSVEGRGPVRVTVERTDLPVSRLLVHFRTENGGASSPAVAESDYLHTEGTLVFEVGVRSSSFTVSVRDDDVPEETEHLLLHLETSSGSGASTRLTILDDDAAPASAPSAETGSPSGAAEDPSPAGAVTAPESAPPVVVASPAGVRRPLTASTRTRTAAARPAPRRIILQQTPTTPFELRPADGSSGPAPAVDPLLALGAGLLLARVAAEAWFRARLGTG